MKSPTTDIISMADVEKLVNAFYHKVQQDNTIGYIFNDVAKVNWETHLPRMYQFWSAILLGTSGFNGNPMAKHVAVNKVEKLKIAHFEQWIALWCATVDELFAGEKAEMAKMRADSIRAIMQHKVQAD